jgi:hypothetical protein
MQLATLDESDQWGTPISPPFIMRSTEGIPYHSLYETFTLHDSTTGEKTCLGVDPCLEDSYFSVKQRFKGPISTHLACAKPPFENACHGKKFIEGSLLLNNNGGVTSCGIDPGNKALTCIGDHSEAIMRILPNETMQKERVERAINHPSIGALASAKKFQDRARRATFFNGGGGVLSDVDEALSKIFIGFGVVLLVVSRLVGKGTLRILFTMSGLAPIVWVLMVLSRRYRENRRRASATLSANAIPGAYQWS